ncbi:MAG: hypothetical protein R2788_25270 [Saprospiraceae bacterium]
MPIDEGQSHKIMHVLFYFRWLHIDEPIAAGITLPTRATTLHLSLISPNKAKAATKREKFSEGGMVTAPFKEVFWAAASAA